MFPVAGDDCPNHEGTQTNPSPTIEFEIFCFRLCYKVDESYTPNCISIRSGTAYFDLQEIQTVELKEPDGWVVIRLAKPLEEPPPVLPSDKWVTLKDPNYNGAVEFIRTHMLQIAIISNHQNGRDTHVREIKIYGPRLRDNMLAPRCLAAKYMFPDPADAAIAERDAKKAKADGDTDVTMDGSGDTAAGKTPEMEYPIDRLMRMEPQMSFQTVDLQQHSIIR